MNKNQKVLLLLTILIVASVLAVITMNYAINSESPDSSFPFNRRMQSINPDDIELYYVARTIFSTINIALLIILTINYISIYLKTRSEFTIGITLFAVFFLIKDLIWSPFIIGAFGFGMFGLGPFAFLPDLFELIALSTLMYLSIKY